MFNPSFSIFAGLSTAQLQAALAAAQQAYLDLSTGNKPVTVAYTQGDGSKSVTYTRAEIGSLVMLIRELQAQLGLLHHPRKPLRFIYR